MSAGRVQLDHFFLFVDSRRRAEQMMREAGLVVNYSRSHPGQGTTNLCACLDDVFLELLWLDGSDVSDAGKQITLADRGRGEGSPLGIAWRGKCHLKTISYSAPFLPNGMVIPVAEASLNRSLPFVFQSPGGVSPIERSDGMTGTRQMPYFSTLHGCRIGLSNQHTATAELLQEFDKIDVVKAATNQIEFDLCNSAGEIAKTISWTFQAPGSV